MVAGKGSILFSKRSDAARGHAVGRPAKGASGAPCWPRVWSRGWGAEGCGGGSSRKFIR